jgi:hypothetical protein
MSRFLWTWLDDGGFVRGSKQIQPLILSVRESLTANPPFPVRVSPDFLLSRQIPANLEPDFPVVSPTNDDSASISLAGGFMKNILGVLALLVSIGMPVWAQAQRMSPNDQDRFNSYYSRWVQDKQTNNRDDMISMEQRMQDLMSKYGIASNTPYDEIASAQGGYSEPNRAYDRGYDREDRGYAGSWQGRMSPDDQHKFNEEYRKWQESMAKNDRDDIEKHARKMEDIMARYNIPANTPFDAVATLNGYSRHYDVREFQGRLSPDDQNKFNKEYREWLEERREGDRNGIAKHEGKMQEIMARYNIPRDVPYDVIASGGGY